MSQKDRVRTWLETHGRIDCNDAYQRLGIKHNSLCNAIFDLRNEGMEIETKSADSTNMWGEPVKISWYEYHRKDGDQFCLL